MPFIRFINVHAYCITSLFLFTFFILLAPPEAVAQQVTRADVSLTDVEAISGDVPEFSRADAGALPRTSDLFDTRGQSDITAAEGQDLLQTGAMLTSTSSGTANFVADETFVNDYVVTNTNNSGDGSLVWAINQVNSNS
ncbi:MAG: hypothetical protein EA364_15295, partial [Balneolaceae bacterium]